MIIWSRWGILVFVFFGLSVGLGFGLKGVISPDSPTDGPLTNLYIGLGFLIGAGALWSFCTLALPRLDAPKPLVLHEKLDAPVRTENGATRTHRTVPMLHPETGEQIYSRPRSTFFFIPMRFWWILLAAIGAINVVLGIVNS